MSALVDRLMRMTITVSSPDGNLQAKSDSERNARFRFRDKTAFNDYKAPELSRQIGELLRSLALGRATGIREVYRAEGRTFTEPDEPHWNAAHRRFHEALSRSRPIGVSDQGVIAVAATMDLDDFRVRIDAEDLYRVDADTFVQELAAAYRNLLLDRRGRRAVLLDQYRIT